MVFLMRSLFLIRVPINLPDDEKTLEEIVLADERKRAVNAYLRHVDICAAICNVGMSDFRLCVLFWTVCTYLLR